MAVNSPKEARKAEMQRLRQKNMEELSAAFDRVEPLPDIEPGKPNGPNEGIEYETQNIIKRQAARKRSALKPLG